MRALRVACPLCCSQLHLLEHLHQRTLLRCVCPRKFVCVCVCLSACLQRTVDVTAGLMINGDIASCIESEGVSETGARERAAWGGAGRGWERRGVDGSEAERRGGRSNYCSDCFDFLRCLQQPSRPLHGFRVLGNSGVWTECTRTTRDAPIPLNRLHAHRPQASFRATVAVLPSMWKGVCGASGSPARVRECGSASCVSACMCRDITRSRTHTHARTRTLTHKHTHTHTRSLSRSLSIALSLSQSLRVCACV